MFSETNLVRRVVVFYIFGKVLKFLLSGSHICFCIICHDSTYYVTSGNL